MRQSRSSGCSQTNEMRNAWRELGSTRVRKMAECSTATLAFLFANSTWCSCQPLRICLCSTLKFTTTCARFFFRDLKLDPLAPLGVNTYYCHISQTVATVPEKSDKSSRTGIRGDDHFYARSVLELLSLETPSLIPHPPTCRLLTRKRKPTNQTFACPVPRPPACGRCTLLDTRVSMTHSIRIALFFTTPQHGALS